MDGLKGALKALQVGGETSKQANAWLEQFEALPESWSHSDSLLREPSSAQNADGPFYRHWGSKMLHSKVQRYFHQLGPEQVPSLTQSLLAHLFAFSQQTPMEFPVCRCLCLSIAALAVQLNQEGMVAQILQWVNPLIATAPKVVLELLIVLPEEVHNRHIDVTADQRDAFLAQLTASNESIFGFLATLWPSASVATKNDILKCLERWIDLTVVAGSTLAAQPIFTTALDALSDPDLFDAATDVAIVTIQRYECTKNFDILQLVLPRIIGLRGLWGIQLAALNKDPEDDEAMQACRLISRVFAEMGERYMKLIFSSTDVGQGEIIQQLLECSRFRLPGSAHRESLEIAQIPMRFFFDLSQEMHCSKQDHLAAPLIDAFSPVFASLLTIIMDQVQVSAHKFVDAGADESYKELTQDEQDVRNEWRDAIVDCQLALGTETTMQTICTSLQACCALEGAQPWHIIESRLFAVHVIAPYVVGAEAPATLLPFVMDCISRMPDVGPMMGTVMELVGRLSKWLALNPSYLPHFMMQLGQALRTAKQSNVAAKALKSILADCYAVPGLPIEQMHELLIETRKAGKLSTEADCEIIEGFRKVIVHMPPEQQGPALQHLMEPIIQSLALSVSAGSSSAAAVIPNLDRLNSAIKFEEGAPNLECATFLPLFVQAIPILQTVLEVVPTDPVAEKVCRCYKNGMRTSRDAFLPYLPAMCDHLTKMFELRQYSAFMYAGSCCVQNFGALSVEAQQVLYQVREKQINRVFLPLNPFSRFI